MKQIFTRIVLLLLLTVLFQAAIAQTYNITASVSSSIMGATGFSTCTNCVFNLSPGVVFTINTGGDCIGCTFNGGTVNISSTSTVTWNNSATNTTTFNNDTVLINAPNSIQNMNFSGDSVAINSPISFSTATTISNSRVSSDTSFTPSTIQFTNSRYTFKGKALMTVSNGLTSTNSSYYLNGKSTITSNSTTSLTGGSLVMADSTSFKASNALPITNTDITMGSDSKLTASSLTVIGGSITADSSIIQSSNNLFLYGDTLTLSGISALSGAYFSSHNNGTTKGIINLSGSSKITSNNGDTLSYTTTNMSGTSAITGAWGIVSHDTVTQSGNSDFVVTNTLLMDSTDVHLDGNAIDSANILELDSSTYLQVGDGTAGTAHAWSNNALEVLVGSNLDIDAHTNYFHTGVSNFTGGTTGYPLTATTGSCGGPGEHTCVLNYVYGCATMSASGAIACITLALADISLVAAPAGADAVNLSWSDGQSAMADHYVIQRSADNSDWTNLDTIAAGRYTAGDYQFEDPAAPAGMDNYRIARVDQDGAILYSAISSVTIAPAATVGAIAIYPNPAIGHTFFIRVPNTEQLTITVYTVTGQVLLRQSLRGQTQYQVLLPSQLSSGGAVIVQTIQTEQSRSFPLLLR